MTHLLWCIWSRKIPVSPKYWIYFFRLCGLLLCWSSKLWAAPYTLKEGLEKDVITLCNPYQLGGEIGTSGFRLWDISIQSRKIDFSLRPPEGGQEAHFSLVHPDSLTDATGPRSAHFLLVPAADLSPNGRAAVDAVFAAIRENDKEDLWSITKGRPGGNTQSTTTGVARAAAVVNRWSQVDGIVFLLLLCFLSLALAVRLLAREPLWMSGALAGITMVGAVLRFTISPEYFLGAWPWSRLWPSVRAVLESSWMDEIVQRTGPLFLTDIIAWTHGLYAALMPLVLFAHASLLLKDTRMGLCAAFFIAILPQHLRFSRAEDAFIPSLVLTSIAFAAIHAWLRDPSRIVRLIAFVILPPLLYMGYQLRPLNLAFTAVYLAAILLLHPESAPRHRRWMGAALILGIALATLPEYIHSNEETLKSSVSNPKWLLFIPLIILDPRLFVLTDPRMTPPLLLFLAVFGVWISWRSEERRTVLFLLGWLLLFVVLHSVVTLQPMQPRYHMHLVVPFLLLASIGVVRFWEYPQEKVRQNRIITGAACILALSPLLYLGFIQDRSYTEIQEYTFVLAMRDKIPDRCTVIEYSGDDARAINLRFARIGALVGAPMEGRFQSIPAFDPGIKPLNPQTPTLASVLAHPPPCLYLYEGLSCMMASDDGPCAALRSRFILKEIAHQEVPLKMYDRGNYHPSRRDTIVSFTLSQVEGLQSPPPTENLSENLPCHHMHALSLFKVTPLLCDMNHIFYRRT